MTGTKKAAKKTPSKAKRQTGLPNLDNATPEIIVDWLGSAREQIKELQQLEGYYKEALKARIDEGQFEVWGAKFSAEIIDVAQRRIDGDAVKSEMGEEWWEDHCKLIEFQQIRTKRITPK